MFKFERDFRESNPKLHELYLAYALVDLAAVRRMIEELYEESRWPRSEFANILQQKMGEYIQSDAAFFEASAILFSGIDYQDKMKPLLREKPWRHTGEEVMGNLEDTLVGEESLANNEEEPPAGRPRSTHRDVVVDLHFDASPGFFEKFQEKWQVHARVFFSDESMRSFEKDQGLKKDKVGPEDDELIDQVAEELYDSHPIGDNTWATLSKRAVKLLEIARKGS